MRRATLTILMLTVAACAPTEPRAAAQSDVNAGAWRHNALWDDGNAELCAYEVQWPRYGNVNPGRALLVLVKEPWDPVQNVKADSAKPGGFDVMKLNHLRDVPTGVYTYHQLASVFFRRDDASFVKLASSSAEACGLTTAHKVGAGPLEVQSYFDGAGDRSVPWPATALPQDALPVLLRDWVIDAVPPAELLVFPTLLDSKLAKLEPRRMRVTRRDVGEIEVGGLRLDAIELKLVDERGWLSYVFAWLAPHQLLELSASDGTRYRMAKCGRARYWEMHDPGGEQWLPASVR